MAADQLELRVAVDAEGFDPDALAECVAGLGEELAECDVDEVGTAVAGDAPPGAKGVELVAVGALIVKLVRSRELLAQVVGSIRDWLSRNDAEKVRVEINGDVLELTGASPAERKALIDAWVKRHSEP